MVRTVIGKDIDPEQDVGVPHARAPRVSALHSRTPSLLARSESVRTELTYLTAQDSRPGSRRISNLPTIETPLILDLAISVLICEHRRTLLPFLDLYPRHSAMMSPATVPRAAKTLLPSSFPHSVFVCLHRRGQRIGRLAACDNRPVIGRTRGCRLNYSAATSARSTGSDSVKAQEDRRATWTTLSRIHHKSKNE
jgi:hypothetical protein